MKHKNRKKSKSRDKVGRVLSIYTKLLDGIVVNKLEEAANYGVDHRSIQRDIDAIRNFLLENADETGGLNSVVYSRKKKGYHLEKPSKIELFDGEALAICKILLDSRAFSKKELEKILGKLAESCIFSNSRRLVREMVRNEEFHYEEPHGEILSGRIWEISKAISQHNYMELEYIPAEGVPQKCRIKPMSLMFLGHCFYLLGAPDAREVVREEEKEKIEVEKGTEEKEKTGEKGEPEEKEGTEEKGGLEEKEETAKKTGTEEEAGTKKKSEPDRKADDFSGQKITLYKLDAISNFTVQSEGFEIQYRDRFQDGEYRRWFCEKHATST